jgi:hypothetical protein
MFILAFARPAVWRRLPLLQGLPRLSSETDPAESQSDSSIVNLTVASLPAEMAFIVQR